MPMKIYIYAIWFPTSKRPNPYYVGVAKNLERRMFQHLNSKYQVGNALNKYDDWIIKKLHTCKTYEEAFRIEIEEIRNFNSVAPNGYNLTRGGDGADTFTNNPNREEIREKFSKSHQGKESGAKGYKWTEEQIENNRQAQSGKKLSEEHKQKIRGYKHTKEAIEKIRVAGKRPCKEETKEKIKRSEKGKKRPYVAKLNKDPKLILKRRISYYKTMIKKSEEGE